MGSQTAYESDNVPTMRDFGDLLQLGILTEQPDLAVS